MTVFRLRLPSDEKKITQGAKGEWPRFARVPQAPDSRKHTAKDFLDKRCLVDGKDWEAGFILSLMHSLVFVPIKSAFKIHVTDQDSKEYKGSVGLISIILVSIVRWTKFFWCTSSLGIGLKKRNVSSIDISYYGGGDAFRWNIRKVRFLPS
jgi:hypothetical protein